MFNMAENYIIKNYGVSQWRLANLVESLLLPGELQSIAASPEDSVSNLHIAAASRYLEAMRMRPEQTWCNNDTGVGRKVREFIDTAAYPAKQQFMPSEHPALLETLKDGPSIVYEVLEGEPSIIIPTTAFIAAQGIESGWGAGREHGEKNHPITGETMPGREVVARYAAMPAETAPPVSSVLGIMHGHNAIVYVSEDAHRTAAAVVRGDEDIEVRQVKLYHAPDFEL